MRKFGIVCAGLALTVVLAGCGADAPPSSSGVSKSAPAPAVTPPGLREAAPADGRAQSPDQTSTRKEVVTGSVDITATDPVAAAATIADQVEALDGRVDSRTEQPGTTDGDPSATLTVRVPADRTDTFIDGLGGLGEVTRVSTNREDVTMQWEDLDAKIRALQASVDRLRALIAGATTTSDLLDAESALSSRQGELDSLTAQKRRLDDEISLSTLTLTVTAPESVVTANDGPDNFWDGLVSGWDSLVDWLHDAVVFLGKAIPWLAFFGILGTIVWGLRRLVRGIRTPKPAPRPGTAARHTDTSAAAPVVEAKSSGGSTVPKPTVTAPSEQADTAVPTGTDDTGSTASNAGSGNATGASGGTEK